MNGVPPFQDRRRPLMTEGSNTVHKFLLTLVLLIRPARCA
jgi:hypothetical protein